jgi:hypothetical protein
MNTRKLLWLALLATFAAAPAIGQQQTFGDELHKLVSDGEFDLSFRYRFEFVDQDGFDEDAEASTVRTRLSVKSGEFRDASFFIEVDDVRQIIWDNFDQGGGNTPGRAEYPVVADPDGTDLNQAYINYAGLDDWGFRLGRQRINLDNQRFVGGVGWRQNEQTFDAFRVDYRLLDKVDIFYSYVDKVRRIFGDEVRAGKDRQDMTQFVNVSGETPIGKLVGYYYYYDTDDRNSDVDGTASFSSGTGGVRLTGGRGNNPNNVDEDYWHLDVGASMDIYEAHIGWEVLTGDDGDPRNVAFQTPLATLHAFNGWADVFLTTPPGGLDDKYVKFKATPGDFVIDARYHTFEAESGGADYGDEIDLRVGYKFNKRFRGDLYFAAFDGDDFGDVTKFWFMASYAL